MTVISFRPKQIARKLLGVLPERAQDVLSKRFGLEGDERMTLEKIGTIYGITRERVRQIESGALQAIRKSDAFASEKTSFDELADLIVSLGGVVEERDFLSHIAKDQNTQNHVTFFLVLGDSFVKHKEDNDFNYRWVVDADIADKVHIALRKLYTSLSNEDLISEEDVISRFLGGLKDVSDQYKDEETARRWLSISKKVGRNPLGEWGIAQSPNIKARGMRDYAFLVIRKHGNPMHFGEVAKAIEDTFGRKAHIATCHNELIKDSRFVLVGRGLYALSDWGYASGVVRDVVREILKKEGPLPKEEIIERVLKERYVRPNTIMVNLQNKKHFKKDKKGRYILT